MGWIRPSPAGERGVSLLESPLTAPHATGGLRGYFAATARRTRATPSWKAWLV